MGYRLSLFVWIARSADGGRVQYKDQADGGRLWNMGVRLTGLFMDGSVKLQAIHIFFI
jgi:hypothetical protein